MMISHFVREKKRYTQQDLCGLLECTEEEIVVFIRKLKEYGVLKPVKNTVKQKDMSDLADEDIEIADVGAGENDYLYVFTFVGVIVVAGRVLKCFPKYLLHNDNPAEEFCQVIKVLEKYNSEKQIVRMFNDSSESKMFNLLTVLLFLLQDYYENGVYSNTEEIIESNGSGEIFWDKTINETSAILLNNRPYYADLQTKKRINNDYDYFKRLHESILTKASKELQEAELLQVFDITEVDLADEGVEDFGDNEYILYRIEKELNLQFNTRKQLLLKAIYAYIDHNGNLFDIDCLSVFGTNSFQLVWEHVCADIMDNQLKRPIETLKLPVPLKPEYQKKARLIDIIEKPLWTVTGKRADDTLIPDLVSIKETDGDFYFLIIDAKYYNARLEMDLAPTGQPGIESITKQYLYQLSYQKFVEDHEFTAVKNCFLMPTEEKEVLDKGEVLMAMLQRLGLQNIKVRFLPAALAFYHYLTGQKLDISKLGI